MFGRKPGEGSSDGLFRCFCQRSEIDLANGRIGADQSRRGFVAGMAASMLALVMPEFSSAQSPLPANNPAQPIGLTNFRLFDGKSGTLRDGLFLVVQGGRIATLSRSKPAALDVARLIDGGGRVLMPGLIDMHWHSMLAALPLQSLMNGDMGFVYLAAGAEARNTLLRGFTTIRDAGGPSFALKQAIDQGLMAGPRIYPSGAMITTTGGHGDFRTLADLPRSGGQISEQERTGGSIIADTVDEVRLRVREQCLQGASQIKLVGSGGVSTPRSPLDMLTFSEPQLRAAVETASDWGTYVLVHAYTPAAVQRAIAAGARCIEHGHLMDDATARLMADKGIWLSLQPFLSDDDSVPLSGPSREKQLEVFAGTQRAYTLARKYGIKTAFGSDLLFSPLLARRQGTMLTHLANWYSPAEALTMATATNAQLLALSGKRNPYPGKLGVLEEGAFADMILVDGNPLEDLSLVADPDRRFVLIMKDGVVHKNTLGKPGT